MPRSARAYLTVLVMMAFAAPSALAVPPTLTAVGEQDLHPTVEFVAPGAGDVSVYIASLPDRATDGSFLQENIVKSDALTTAEIQSGRWLDDAQIDPGSYFVMLRASRDIDQCVRYPPPAYDRIENASCADGFSNVVPLTIAAPETSYRAKAQVLSFIRELYLTITADPLGTRLPYKVCWRQPVRKTKKLTKRCVNGALSGYSWKHDASDTVNISTKGMTRRTKFTWYTRGDNPGIVLRTKTFEVF